MQAWHGPHIFFDFIFHNTYHTLFVGVIFIIFGCLSDQKFLCNFVIWERLDDLQGGSNLLLVLSLVTAHEALIKVCLLLYHQELLILIRLKCNYTKGSYLHCLSWFTSSSGAPILPIVLLSDAINPAK